MSQPPASISGLRYMAQSALAFSVMSALVKQAGTRLPSQGIVFVRSLVSLALLRHAGVSLWGQRRGLRFLRGLRGYAALSCVFFAVTHLPLAEATRIQYLQIAFAAVWGWLLFAERPGSWTLAGAALIGASAWIGARAAVRERAVRAR